jgi:hypothetical protein
MYTTARFAVEIEINGFPVPVGIKLHPRTPSSKNGSGLKLLSPEGKSVKQQYVAFDDSWSGTIGQCKRGIERDGTVTMLSDEALASLGEAERTKLATAHSFAPLDSIDLSLATESYTVVPDDKQPGSERSIQALWNGLRVNRLAYVAEDVVFKGGGPDRLLILHADDRGLWASVMPRAEAQDPGFQWERNDAVGEAFLEHIQAGYEIRPFAATEHPSAATARRQAILDQVLAGQPVEAPTTPEKDVATPDLMAILEGKAKAAKTAATTTSKKEVAA